MFEDVIAMGNDSTPDKDFKKVKKLLQEDGINVIKGKKIIKGKTTLRDFDVVILKNKKA